MKPLPTKSQIRAEMDRQVQQYLQEGGRVDAIPRGQSGYNNNQNPFTQYNTHQPPESRTPLDHVVKTLEARKHPHTNDKPKNRPKKRLITDDFGEPLRWVWDKE